MSYLNLLEARQVAGPVIPVEPAPDVPMPDQPTFERETTREGWLDTVLAKHVVPFVKAKTGLDVPPVFVSCAFPSHGGLPSFMGGHVIGQCWHPEAQEGVAQIFVTPLIDDAVHVLDILVHEVLHAALPLGTGHKLPFAKAAEACLLDGPATATHGSEAFKQWAADVVKDVGAYPHKPLLVNGAPIIGPQGPDAGPGFRGFGPRRRCGGEDKPKKQTTRLIKCECSACGYKARVTGKWLEQAGAPLCPTHKTAMDYQA